MILPWIIFLWFILGTILFLITRQCFPTIPPFKKTFFIFHIRLLWHAVVWGLYKILSFPYHSSDTTNVHPHWCCYVSIRSNNKYVRITLCCPKRFMRCLESTLNCWYTLKFNSVCIIYFVTFCNNILNLKTH